MTMTTVDRCKARIEYDAELHMPRGEILGLNGGAGFWGKNPKGRRAKFKKSLQVFYDVCREKGVEPRRSYSGKFNLRISRDLHEKLAIVAETEGKGINTLTQEAIRQRVALSGHLSPQAMPQAYALRFNPHSYRHRHAI